MLYCRAVKPSKELAVDVPEGAEVVFSSAALASGSHAKLRMTCEDGTFVVATLHSKSAPQFQFNLLLEEESNTLFNVEGDGEVHLVGNMHLVPEDELLGDGSSSEDDHDMYQLEGYQPRYYVSEPSSDDDEAEYLQEVDSEDDSDYYVGSEDEFSDAPMIEELPSDHGEDGDQEAVPQLEDASDELKLRHEISELLSHPPPSSDDEDLMQDHELSDEEEERDGYVRRFDVVKIGSGAASQPRQNGKAKQVAATAASTASKKRKPRQNKKVKVAAGKSATTTPQKKATTSKKQGTPQAKKPNTPRGKKPNTPQAKKPNTPQAKKNNNTPQKKNTPNKRKAPSQEAVTSSKRSERRPRHKKAKEAE